MSPSSPWWPEQPSIICLVLALQVCVNAIAVVPAAHRGPGDWLGLALYPRAAMLNHACEPNVAASFVGLELRLHALTALEPSAILRLSYGPQVWLLTAFVGALWHSRLHRCGGGLCARLMST